MLPEGGCALPGEGVCPCTPLGTPSSILDLQIEPRAEQLGLPRVSGSQPTACSLTQDGCSTNPADFPEHQGLLETSAPRRAGQSHSQAIPSSAQRHFQRPCPATLLLSHSLTGNYKLTEMGTYRIPVCLLPLSVHVLNFWKCCNWQEPLGLLAMDKVPQLPGAHPDMGLMSKMWSDTWSAPLPNHIQQFIELPIWLTRHLDSPKHTERDNHTSTCPGTAALWQQVEDKNKRKMTRTMDAKMDSKMFWFSVGHYLCLRALALKKAAYSLKAH